MFRVNTLGIAPKINNSIILIIACLGSVAWAPTYTTACLGPVPHSLTKECLKPISKVSL